MIIIKMKVEPEYKKNRSTKEKIDFGLKDLQDRKMIKKL